MTGGIAGLLPVSAALMMAALPVTGQAEGRVVLMCHPDGLSRQVLVWDDETPTPEPAASKACHACTFERKRAGKDDRKARGG